jgi:hypothetical protein
MMTERSAIEERLAKRFPAAATSATAPVAEQATMSSEQASIESDFGPAPATSKKAAKAEPATAQEKAAVLRQKAVQSAAKKAVSSKSVNLAEFLSDEGGAKSFSESKFKLAKPKIRKLAEEAGITDTKEISKFYAEVNGLLKEKAKNIPGNKKKPAKAGKDVDNSEPTVRELTDEEIKLYGLDTVGKETESDIIIESIGSLSDDIESKIEKLKSIERADDRGEFYERELSLADRSYIGNVSSLGETLAKDGMAYAKRTKRMAKIISESDGTVDGFFSKLYDSVSELYSQEKAGKYITLLSSMHNRISDMEKNGFKFSYENVIASTADDIRIPSENWRKGTQGSAYRNVDGEYTILLNNIGANSYAVGAQNGVNAETISHELMHNTSVPAITLGKDSREMADKLRNSGDIKGAEKIESEFADYIKIYDELYEVGSSIRKAVFEKAVRLKAIRVMNGRPSFSDGKSSIKAGLSKMEFDVVTRDLDGAGLVSVVDGELTLNEPNTMERDATYSTNPKEIVTWTLFDKNYLEMLRGIKSNGKNLLQRIIDSLSYFLGVSESDMKTLVGDVLSATSDIMSISDASNIGKEAWSVSFKYKSLNSVKA